MIDQERAQAEREGDGWEATGWTVLKGLYIVSTVGFALVHDPVRDAYDRGEVSGSEYVAYGIGGGAAAVGATVLTGGLAAGAVAGASTATAVAIMAGAGVLEGTVLDGITQGVHVGAGIQDEYNVTQTLEAGIFGGILGAGGAMLGATARGVASSRLGLAVSARATQLRAQAAEAISNVGPGLTARVQNGSRAMRRTLSDASASFGQMREQVAQVRASATQALRQKAATFREGFARGYGDVMGDAEGALMTGLPNYPDAITAGVSDGLGAVRGSGSGGAGASGPFTPVADRIEALLDLQRARTALGPLPSGAGVRHQADGGVLASLRVGEGPRVYGANNVAERSLGVAAEYSPPPGSRLVFANGAPSPTLGHAEGNVFARAQAEGLSGQRGVLAVDAPACSFCEWGIEALGREMGLESLTVHVPGIAPYNALK